MWLLAVRSEGMPDNMTASDHSMGASQPPVGGGGFTKLAPAGGAGRPPSKTSMLVAHETGGSVTSPGNPTRECAPPNPPDAVLAGQPNVIKALRHLGLDPKNESEIRTCL